ncbi:D-glutamate cyclase family protein [Chloroflexota bacterium]
MGKVILESLQKMSPSDFRSVVRKGEWTGITLQSCKGEEIVDPAIVEVCKNHVLTDLVIIPREYAFEFLLFCNRNPRFCPIIAVTDPGDPEPKQVAPGADLRTDLPKYSVYRDGKLIDEPNDITGYWRDDLVAFLIGCFENGCGLALEAANIQFRWYGSYPATFSCVPAGRIHGPMMVSVRAFKNAQEAVRAIQISSRHPLMHGPPIHIGDPAEIGITLGKPDPFHPEKPAVEPPKPGEVLLSFGCGLAGQTAALESKIPLVITHNPCHQFLTDRLPEELALL